MPNGECCRNCVWWDTDARRVTISAPCRLTHLIHRPADACSKHAPHVGPRALEPVLVRISG